MLEALGAGTRLGYCTNVHAGHDLRTTLENLERHSVAVRRKLGVQELGVGLWLSAEAAREAKGQIELMRDRLRTLRLRVFTLNGFPYSNFHESVVKHRVYEPDWGDERRLQYTLDLMDVLGGLLDEGEEGSISTLPVGWPGAPCPAVDMVAARVFLVRAAQFLAQYEDRTGRLIHLDLEPEPGCILQRSTDAVKLWEAMLAGCDAGMERIARRHLRVCHDVCHSAVMFEPQAEAFAAYWRAGIKVGKVQISSAVKAIGAAARGLDRFAEPRYLHQTCVKAKDGLVRRFEDLPEALVSGAEGEWRVHFHVPIHLRTIGELGTTQDEIRSAMRLALEQGVKHFEVETYAWTVLPEEMRPAELADGIAEEMKWAMGIQK
jgi:hypothetical protein